MPASANKFNVLPTDIAHGKHNFSSDTIKVALSNTAPNPTFTNFSQISEITTTGFGYAAGGVAFTRVSSGASSATPSKYRYVVAPVTIINNSTDPAQVIGPFRYVIVYNSNSLTDQANPNSGRLIGWFDYGATIQLLNGESFTIAPVPAAEDTPPNGPLLEII